MDEMTPSWMIMTMDVETQLIFLSIVRPFPSIQEAVFSGDISEGKEYL